MSKPNLEKEFEQHLSWMQSMIGDTGSSSNNAGKTTNDYESQIDDLIASIQTPPETRQSKVSDVCQQYSDLNKDAYDSQFGSMTPSPLTRTQSTEVRQYRISDPIDDDEEEDSECEEYYVEDAAEIRGQAIPDWARAANLLVELQKQQGVDPDKIFTNFERTCDLSSMFEKKKRSFKVRGDSGWWAADGLTPAEEANYKKAVGLA
ncbi:hypothetical protein TRFO_19287 [Tritrichomonas foetus]|uniref:Inner centromere protein ARK-binding domain-containing protein n=1 Tax=Tritrichomonas foetus TaxID=1144522 RepID=A0A1J4KJB1_9EUKA|nr:hypothetical protein TRFO_19287 [Tritrichomonas foetus]|eukprot:OHT11307.1 hypothetical protein TRFO_19287 [Tritrichomonas foetus]